MKRRTPLLDIPCPYHAQGIPELRMITQRTTLGGSHEPEPSIVDRPIWVIMVQIVHFHQIQARRECAMLSMIAGRLRPDSGSPVQQRGITGAVVRKLSCSPGGKPRSREQLRVPAWRQVRQQPRRFGPLAKIEADP